MLGSLLDVDPSSRVTFGAGCWRVKGSVPPGTARKRPWRACLFPQAGVLLGAGVHVAVGAHVGTSSNGETPAPV